MNTETMSADPLASSGMSLVNPPQPLGERARAAMRARQFSQRTENTYLMWMRRFHAFHGGKNPARLGADELRAFLASVSEAGGRSAATQNQALSSICFLYRGVLGLDPPWLGAIERARGVPRRPTVLTHAEVEKLLSHLDDASRAYGLMARLMYGAGLRLLEVCRLRVKDVDFGRGCVTTRDRFGEKARDAMLPRALVEPLRAQVEVVARQHAADVLAGAGWVDLPKYVTDELPGAARSLPWQWLFPSTRLRGRQRVGEGRRGPMNQSLVQHAVQQAVVAAGLPPRIACRALRHSFAARLIEDGCDLATVQAQLGHAFASTTRVYRHVAQRRAVPLGSPLDRIPPASAPPST